MMNIFSRELEDKILSLEKTNKHYWNIPREVAQMLYLFIRLSGCQRVLEIGTSNGYSTIWMAQALKDNKIGYLWTVESNITRFKLAEKNFLTFDLNQIITQVFGHAPEIFDINSNIREGNFDLLFLDATKKQYQDILNQCYPFIKKGGLVIADNIQSHQFALENFVINMQSDERFDSDILKIGDGLLIAVKN